MSVVLEENVTIHSTIAAFNKSMPALDWKDHKFRKYVDWRYLRLELDESGRVISKIEQ